MIAEDEVLLYSAAAVAIIALKKKKRKRQIWTKDWLTKRIKYSHINLLNELKFHPKDWHNYLRMTEDTYFELLSKVAPAIARKDTAMRKAISPHERLTASLRFLATGRSYEDLKFSTIIAPQTLGKIIPETCKALVQALKDYVKFPTTEEEWRGIAKVFEVRWNFPNCLGAVDGKHIAITPPPGAGSYFFNYKKFHSQVLLGIANANYEFIYFHFGTNGRVSDGGVLQNTDFYRLLESGTLKINPPSNIKGHKLPHVFIGDDAFCLRNDFIKPYSGYNVPKEKKIYNYRVSRARRIIENVFGILVNRFRVLKTPINLCLENIEVIVLACCALHNFLRRNSPDTYTPADAMDMEDFESGSITEGLRSELTGLQVTRTMPTNSAKAVREQFLTYFNGVGSVAWQEQFIY